ncbi:MAG: DUF58 domain-containing protein [Saprospiraceae bacterium]|nr:DUF58 domain-containing protein [Saprospiraceae bacterium]
MLTQDILRKVRQIEIKTKGLSQHLFSGAYHSHFKGRGMSFSEVREYAMGDDIRHIDWNVTARTGQTQVKVFEEERELTLMLLIDISKSMYFGTKEKEKFLWAAEIAAVLAFSATQNHDKVGLILFSDVIHLYIPPKKGKQHILRMIRELLVQRSDSGTTNYHLPLQYLNRVQNKRCISFLISDFQSDVPETTLKIVARRHDLIGLQLRDPLEKEIPKVGLLQFKDLESGLEMIIDTDDPNWHQKYKQSQQLHQTKIKQALLRAKAEFLELEPDDTYIKTLLNFFKKRN